MSNNENRYNDPHNLVLRIALWEHYDRRDIYYGDLIPFRELEVDHIIPRDLYKKGKEKERKETLAKYGLDPDFKENDLLNFVPASGSSNGKKTNALLPAVVAYGLATASKNKDKIIKKIDRYYESFNNSTNAVKTRLELAKSENFDDELYNYIDILLDDVKPFESKNSNLDYVSVLSNKRIRLVGQYPKISNGFRSACTIQFRTLKARDVTVALDYKFIYQSILPDYKRNIYDRSYLTYQSETNEFYLRFPGTFILINKCDAEELCGLLDLFSDNVFKLLTKITQEYSMTSFKLYDNKLLLLKVKKGIIQKLYEFIQTHPNYNGFDLSESRRDILKIKEKNKYHGILGFAPSSDQKWYLDEEYYIFERISYLKMNNSEPIWSPNEQKEFLLSIITEALKHSYRNACKKGMFSKLSDKEMLIEVQKDIEYIIDINKPEPVYVLSEIDNGIKLHECLEVMGLYFDNGAMRNIYYISESIYKPLKYLNQRYTLDNGEFNYLLTKLGIESGTSKKDLDEILQDKIKNQNYMYMSNEIRTVLEALLCYMRSRKALGYEEIQYIKGSLKDVIEVYNRERIIGLYLKE